MSDLRAKLTLTLDDKLSAAAKAALSGLEAAAKQAGSGVRVLDTDLDKLVKPGRDSKGKFLPKGIGDEAEKAKPKLRGLAAAVAAFNDKIEAGHKRLFAFREAAGALDDAAATMNRLGEGAVTMARDSTTAAVSWDRAFTDISVKSGFAGDDLKNLELKTKQLGAQFGVLPSEVAKGIDVLAAAGWNEQLKEGGLEDMMLTAKLGFSDFNTTATVGTGILEVYGSKLADGKLKAAANRDMMLQLANAVNASKISMEDLNYGLQDNMTIAKQAGVAYTDLLTMEALLGQKNIKGGVANTATKSLISLLGNPKKDAQRDLASLFGSSKKAKAVFFDEKGVRRQVPEVLASIQKALDESKAPKWVKGGLAREKLMEHLFGIDAKGNAADIMNALTQVVDDGHGHMVLSYGLMKSKIEDTSEAQNNLDKLMSSSGAKLDQAAASWETLKIELGANVLPVLRDVLGWGNDFVRDHPLATKVILGSTLALSGLAKGIGATMTIMSGSLKIWTGAEKAITLVGGSLKGVGLMLTATPWGLALTALAGIVAVGVAAYTQWADVKSIVRSVVDMPEDRKRHAEMVEDKKQVAYDLSAGRISAKDAQAKIASIDGEYKKREALIKNGFEDPGKKRGGGPDANLVGDITQQLQAQLQQVTLPPDVLAALKGGKVEVTVNGADATVKQGGKTRKAKGVPYGKTVPT